MMRAAWLPSTILLALPLHTAFAPSPPAPTEPAPTELRLTGETAAGERGDVPLESLPIASLAELDLILLEVDGAEPPGEPDPAGRAELVLAGGERVAGAVAGGSGEVLSLRLCGDVILPVDISSLASVVFRARIPQGQTQPIEPPAELDRLYRRVGDALDTMDGTVEGFEADGVRFQSDQLGAQRVAWGDVAALFVEVLDEGDRGDAAGEPVVVDLADGSRLRGRMRSLSESGLDLLVGGATAITLPLEVLADVTRDDGSVAYVSDLTPVTELGRGNPFDPEGAPVGLVWPARADRAVHGEPLRAGGRPWRRGFGVHAPTTLGFDLAGAWGELRGAVAIDDSVLLEPADGSVVFRIAVDGEAVWESPVMTAGDAPMAFPPIELKGKRRLTLEADMSTALHQGDRADWLRLLLVK